MTGRNVSVLPKENIVNIGEYSIHSLKLKQCVEQLVVNCEKTVVTIAF